MKFVLFIINSYSTFMLTMNLRKIIFLAIAFSFFACNKNKQHPVPYYSFNANINLTLPSYVNLQGVGGWLMFLELALKELWYTDRVNRILLLSTVIHLQKEV